MIQAIFYDADGVLINKPRRFSQVFSEEFQIPMEKILPFFEKDFPDTLVGKADLRERLDKYLRIWGWRGTVNDLLEYWFKSENYIYDRFLEDIQNLRKKGIKSYLATDQEKYRAEYIKKEMKFDQSFDRIFVSCELGCTKLDPQFWKTVLSDVKLPAENILVWDDEQENVDSARNTGLGAHLYTNFDDYKLKMAEYGF